MISASIILYNPNIDRLDKCIAAILSQVTLVYLIDNNSQNLDEIISLINKNYKGFNHIKLLANNKNMGIAHALNQGIKEAIKDKSEWLLTLDQDTIVPSNIIAEYNKYLDQNQNIGIVACKVHYNNLRYDEQNIETEYVDYAITSASLVNVEICKSLGGYDEQMFIDGVDFEYCFRLRQRAYQIMKINSVIIEHELGNLKIHKLFNRQLNVENHNAIRTYYISRNYIYRYRKNRGYTSIGKCIRKEGDLLVKVVLFEGDKNKKVWSIIKGICDGLSMSVSTMDYIGD